MQLLVAIRPTGQPGGGALALGGTQLAACRLHVVGGLQRVRLRPGHCRGGVTVGGVNLHRGLTDILGQRVELGLEVGDRFLQRSTLRAQCLSLGAGAPSDGSEPFFGGGFDPGQFATCGPLLDDTLVERLLGRSLFGNPRADDSWRYLRGTRLRPQPRRAAACLLISASCFSIGETFGFAAFGGATPCCGARRTWVGPLVIVGAARAASRFSSLAMRSVSSLARAMAWLRSRRSVAAAALPSIRRLRHASPATWYRSPAGPAAGWLRPVELLRQ